MPQGFTAALDQFADWESCAPTRSGWMPAQCKRRAALVLGESADTGRVVAIRKVADYFSGPLLGNSLTPGWRRQTRSFNARSSPPAWLERFRI